MRPFQMEKDMDMDQHNNNQREDGHVILTQGNASDGASSGSNNALIPTITTTRQALPGVKSGPTHSTLGQAFANRRARLNRIIIIKRRQQRSARNDTTAPRLMITALVLAIVLFSLLSSGVGAAYAYYQSQLPLLNGIASHSLFQTTHIYDRNGKLLYDLYDPKYGRRTYVDYNDISPLMVNATIAAEDH